MKLTAQQKKILKLVSIVVIALVLTGCSVPRDEAGNIVLITNETTFQEIMANESWFSAIFVWPLSWLINHLAPYVGVGFAIAIVTILVNSILLLATIRSSIAQQKMQLIQPELERIQRKYEGRNDQNSKAKQAQEMQALYRKYDVNPGSMMLVMFLQFPIIIAMYMAVQRSVAVQTGTFLGMDLQVSPLDAVRSMMGGGSINAIPYVILFAIMMGCQFLASKMPQILQKKKAEEEAQKHHRKPQKASNQNNFMTIYMLGMIGVFGLMLPAAMTLYWMINSLVNVVKTLLVQKVIDKENAKETASV